MPAPLPTTETVDSAVWERAFVPFQLVVKDVEYALRNEGVCEWLLLERPELLAEWLRLLHLFEGGGGGAVAVACTSVSVSVCGAIAIVWHVCVLSPLRIR